MSARRAALLLVLVAAAAGGAWLVGRERPHHLPARILVQDTVTDAVTLFATGGAVAEPADGAKLGALQPSVLFKEHGGYRRALVTAPRTRVRFRTRVPPDGALVLAVAVEGTGKRDTGAAGVRFALTVDGTETWTRVVNPAASRHDRRWFDERIDLARWRDRDVDVVLATDLDGAGPFAGKPGWSGVRIVRESVRDRQQASPATPSVLVLLVDTLRADRLGCYGARPSLTPNLDRLAEGGLLFEQSVSQASWTMPSVATLFTGLHPRSHGVIGGAHLWGTPELGNGSRDTPDNAFLADTLPTLAGEAARAGITTVGVAANPLVGRATNLARGFETFVEFKWDEDQQEPRPAEAVNAEFLRWLAANRERRFLAYLHYMEPHDPYTPPEPFRPASPAGVRPQVGAGNVATIAHRVNRRELPPLPGLEIDHLRRLYDGEIRSWDRELGTLLARLDALGVRDSTVVVMTADHGEEFQEHGHLKHGYDLYDELLRVPLIVAGPGVPPRRRTDQAQGIDLFPTVAGLLGFAPPAGLPGRDLLRTDAPGPALAETRYGAAPDGTIAPLVAARTPRWKLIQTPESGRVELYDLASDPGERDNRFGRAPEGDDLLAFVRGFVAPAPPPSLPGRDPELHERLHALGYVQ